MWASAWINKGEDGSEYITVSVRPKDEASQTSGRSQQSAPPSAQRQSSYKTYRSNARTEVRPPEPPCDVEHDYGPQGDNWERE